MQRKKLLETVSVTAPKQCNDATGPIHPAKGNRERGRGSQQAQLADAKSWLWTPSKEVQCFGLTLHPSSKRRWRLYHKSSLPSEVSRRNLACCHYLPTEFQVLCTVRVRVVASKSEGCSTSRPPGRFQMQHGGEEAVRKP